CLNTLICLVSESVDDVLGDLLGFDGKRNLLCSGKGSVLVLLLCSWESFVEDDFFSRFPAEDVEAAEGSSASSGEPQALLQTLKDMDNLEADLLGISTPGSRPGKPAMKGPGKCDSSGEAVKTAGKLLAPGKGESGPPMEKKPLSSFPASQQYKKFNLEDLDVPLSGLLSDEEQDAPKKPSPTGTKSISGKKTEQSKEKEPPPAQMPLHTVAPVQSRKELMFEDDGDDLMAALGLGSGPGSDEKQGKKAEEEEVRPARAKLDELLGRGSVARILEEPGLGECQEFKLEKKYQKQPDKEEGRNKFDFVFGAYQPSVASTAKGQPARRQPVRYWSHHRFSAENSSEPKAELHSKASPSASQSPVRGCRAGGDWLGLKDEDFMDLELSSPAKAGPAGSSPSPLPAAEEAAAKPDAVEEEDWLSAALSRKKAQAKAKAQEGNAKASEAPGEGLNPCSSLWHCCASPVSLCPRRPPLPWLSTTEQASAHPLEAAQGDPSRDASAPGAFRVVVRFGQREAEGPPGPARTTSQKNRSCSITLVESPGLGLLHERRLGAAVAQPHGDVTGCQAALLRAQARVVELESQVRTLELVRAQDRDFLERLRQRHQEDLDLLESTHRSQVKVVEETCRQQLQRLRQEQEQLVAQLLGQRQEAEQARAELLAQHQQHLAALEQRSVQELERLRELQRVSVQELRRDHEEQLQRLKRLKDQEVDAVTSATSHTRTLNSVIERMEKFSSDLCDILHRVEATHHTTSQELAMGAQKQEKQLRVLQDSLLQQKREAEEERRRFQEVVAKLEARLGEQTRLLEQERQRVLAEHSRVESLQHSLEEERRVLTQQLSMERAELERAKSILLEEQKVLQRCAGEWQKLTSEWAEFHTQQPLSREQDTARALPVESQGEPGPGTSREWAEVKMRVHTLRAREEQLAREKELLDEAWQELKLEQKVVNGAALRVRQQEEKMKSGQKACPGRGSLREAQRVESQHQSRLQALQSQLEQLRQQEEHLHQDQLSMAQQRSQLQQLRQELPNSPTMLRTAGWNSSAPASGFSSMLSKALCLLLVGRDVLGGRCTCIPLLRRLGMFLGDHAYLENEEFFLESLKKASYNAASLPG
uniref:Fas-binding factor 1 C-terminal domain-containing protein n=1 Tax=Athene cunicularia TaxID=194338 RepID=A0A663MQE1_ATHCN